MTQHTLWVPDAPENWILKTDAMLQTAATTKTLCLHRLLCLHRPHGRSPAESRCVALVDDKTQESVTILANSDPPIVHVRQGGGCDDDVM